MRAWTMVFALAHAMAGPATAQCPELSDFGPGRTAWAATAKGGAPSIEWIEFDPIVIQPTRNPAQPVLLRARASGTAQSLVLQYDGGGTLALLDDGVAPDTTAGDGIYSAHLPTPQILSRNSADRNGRPFLGYLRAVINGTPDPDAAINIFGEVTPPDLPNYPVGLRIGAPFTYKTSSHVVNYVDAAFHADHSIEDTVARILPRIGDRYDFVDVLSVQRRYVQNRHHSIIRSNIGGIGVGNVDGGAAFGSAARLKGYTNFPTLSFFDPQERGYNHEIGHQWINHLTGTLDDTVGAHWPVGPLAQDVMGTSGVGGQGIEISCRLLRQGSVVTASGQLNRNTFGSYELYLMGLLPGSQLPITWQFTDQAAARALLQQNNWCSGIIDLATTDISLATLTAAKGARTPASGPRYFTVATLAVGSSRLLDDVELRYLTYLARRGDVDHSLSSTTGFITTPGAPFFLATGGRARLDHRLDAVFRDTFD